MLIKLNSLTLLRSYVNFIICVQHEFSKEKSKHNYINYSTLPRRDTNVSLFSRLGWESAVWL